MKKILLSLMLVVSIIWLVSCQTVSNRSSQKPQETEYAKYPTKIRIALEWFANNPEIVKKALGKDRIIYEKDEPGAIVCSKTFGKSDIIRLPGVAGVHSFTPIYSYDYKKLYMEIIDEDSHKVAIFSISAFDKPHVLYTGDYYHNKFDVSPDESELSFYLWGDGTDLIQLYRFNIKNQTLTRFSNPTVGGVFSSYSPDGQNLAYCSQRKLRVKNIHTGEEKVLVGDDLLKEFPRWSHNGKWIVYQGSLGNGESYDIYKVEVATGKIYCLTDNPGLDANPSFDRTDKNIVYISSAEKLQQNQTLWIMDADGSHKKQDPTSDKNIYFPAH